MDTRGILVTDFDGTLTRFDFFDLVRKRWPLDPAQDPWERYVRGEMTHFDALSEIFANVPASETELLEIASSMELVPGLASAVNQLHDNGWEVVVASAGCRWYIDRLLDQDQVAIPQIHTNPGHLLPERGLQMTAAPDAPFFSHDNGIDKAAVVRDAKSHATRVAFAGDGRPDLPAALEVPPELRFARGWLADALVERNEAFRPFAVWTDIAEILCQ